MKITKIEKIKPRIYLSTWQSIYKMSRQYFDRFECIMGDEVHEYDANSVKGILEKASNAYYRFGFTGTLREGKTNRLVVEGLFGPAIRVMTNKESIERGESSPIHIHMNILRWPEYEQKRIQGAKYQDEMRFLRQNEKRNKLIVGAMLKRPKNENSLCLVVNKDQGKELYEMLQKYDSHGRTVYYVNGDCGTDFRNEVRQSVDQNPDGGIIIIATFGVFQRGINMKNIHHLFFGIGAKSLVRVLQSIGRGLRIGKWKSSIHLWDFIDDLVGKRVKKNYSFDHGMVRYEIYKKEGFDVQFRDINMP